MNEQIERVFELSLEIKLGILISIVGLIAGVYWFTFYKPISEEIFALEKESENLRLEIATKKGLVARLPDAEAKVEALDIKLKEALQQLPDKREIPQLLTKISDKARDAGLEIRMFKPKPERKKVFYAEVPVEIEVHGDYHQVATFFDEVGHLDRIVNLERFALTNPQNINDQIMLGTTVEATAFRFLDESERPKEVEEGDKRRRKRRAT